MPAPRVDSTDPRAERVRQLLREAAFALIEERRVEQISVSDIAQRAGVSRQAFYQHFRDRDDAVATAVAASFRDTTTAEGDPIELIHRLGDYAAKHAVLYGNLYPSAASQQAANAYRDLLRPACTRLAAEVLARRGRPADGTDALASFLIGGIMETARLWAEDATADDVRARLDTCLAGIGIEP
ncbi:TetR/AcrR family transcriptional regulator [Dactylosporangium sp. CS-033363]|uniref:TetR/AcrR family transcriptional regulator n=1 Tax=Dactylosporangium sp. CS-033363 TaxID=3239935 RepID=UPI003D944CD9